MIGQTVSHYKILEQIGRGGMGVVYRAEDTKLGRHVALKFLPAEFTSDERARTRFLHEARAASALEHRNICVIHQIDETEDGQLFIAMALYEGESLKERIARAPLSVGEAVNITRQIAEGLRKAHQKNIVHRDIKPANLLLTEDGEVKIVDFGVAKLTDRTQMTREGSTVGTVAYMAPEQLRGQPVDPRADIWSLGAVLHEMLTGAWPFPAGNDTAMVYTILHEAPDFGMLASKAPPELVKMVRACLEKERDRRLASADQLIANLERFATGSDLAGRRAPATETTAARTVEMPALRPIPLEVLERIPEEGSITDSQILVCRDDELERLDGFLDEALEGHGRVVFVSGEAGQGKSTLVHEFCRRAERRQSDLLAATGMCNAQTGTGDPYLPFREILAQLGGDTEISAISGSSTHERVLRSWNLLPRCAQALVEEGPDLVGTFVAAAPLLTRARSSAPPGAPWLLRLEELIAAKAQGGAAVPQSELFDQYTRVLRVLSASQPMILVLDDLHWVDQGSASLLFHFGRSLQASRILVIGTYRREEIALAAGRERHPMESVVNELQREFGEIELDLDQTEGRPFVDALLDESPNRLGEDFRESLFHQTRGLPLFTIEVLREMKSQGFLVQDGEGRWRTGPDLDWDKVPARAEAVVAERISRIPDELMALLNTASVEGEEFTAEVVARVQGAGERETARLLSGELSKRYRLVAVREIRRANGQRISRYRFRHLLFQRYIYDQLDEVERSYLHEEVGTELERLHGKDLDEIAIHLARHFREAGDSARAVSYLEQAGQRAMRLSAHAEAGELFSEALGLLVDLPEGAERDQQEFRLQTGLGTALTLTRGYGAQEVETAYVRAHELCKKIGATPDLLLVLHGLWMYFNARARLDEALELAKQMLALVDLATEATLAMDAHYAIGATLFFLGDLEGALSEFDDVAALDSADRDGAVAHQLGYDPGLVGRSFRARTLWLLGRPQQALEAAHEAVEAAREGPHPTSLAITLGFLAIVEQYSRCTREETLDEAVRVAHDQGAIYWEVVTEMVRGWSQAVNRQEESATGDGASSAVEGIEGLQRGLATRMAFGTRTETAYYRCLLAEALLARGDMSAAGTLLEETLAEVGETGEEIWVSELHRLRGEVLAAGDPDDEITARAEASFDRALKLAAGQGARSLELRAAIGLARLLAAGDRAAEGRRRLESIYDSFSQGHELPDLREAAELLGNGA